MGYIHNVEMSQFISPSMFMFNAGTWTDVTDTYVWSKTRAAADASVWITIPVIIPSNSIASRGSYLKTIEVMYSIGTAACDAMGEQLIKDTLNANGSVNTAEEIAHSCDAAHDAAGRLALGYHRMTVTLTTPAWIDQDEFYHVDMLADCALTTVLKYYGALVNYTLRL